MVRALNEKPFQHRARNGTVFVASRCDFVGGVTAYAPRSLSIAEITADAIEVGAWHWANVVPHLNGFTGPPTMEVRRMTYKPPPLLETPLLDFFTLERLRAFSKQPRRTHSILKHEMQYRRSSVGLSPIDTLGDFLRHVTRQDMLRIPNMGESGLKQIENVLETHGLNFRA